MAYLSIFYIAIVFMFSFGYGQNQPHALINYIYIYDVIHSMLPKAGACMTLKVVPCSDFTVDMHVITMVRIRLWLLGIISAMLGLRMLQLLCRLPIKLLSYYMRIKVRFELLAIWVSHRGLNCIFSALTILDNALTS